jgi:transcriptional regulator with XRE-family HTH domain
VPIGIQLLFSNHRKKYMGAPGKFDFSSYFKALASTVTSRNTNWKAVSQATGVSQTTLSRMARGRQPDAESLTSLSAWAGLNPVDFIHAPKRRAEPLALMGKLLREDPNLDQQGADALEAIIATAYTQLRRDRKD